MYSINSITPNNCVDCVYPIISRKLLQDVDLI